MISEYFENAKKLQLWSEISMGKVESWGYLTRSAAVIPNVVRNQIRDDGCKIGGVTDLFILVVSSKAVAMPPFNIFT